MNDIIPCWFCSKTNLICLIRIGYKLYDVCSDEDCEWAKRRREFIKEKIREEDEE